YSWYLQQSRKSGGSDLTLKRSSNFSQEILRGLAEDAAAQRKSPQLIVGLDFDPILNAQDFADRYVGGKVTRSGDHYRADVYGISGGKKSRKPDVTPELVFEHGRWIFVNFHYGAKPKHPEEENLLSLLKAIRE